MLILNLCLLTGLIHISAGNMFYDETAVRLNFTKDLQAVLKKLEISSKCKDQFWQYGLSLISTEPEDFWAKQMFDAGTKIPSGLLEGLSADLGAFDECINIEAVTKSYEIYGQYCLGVIPLSGEQQANSKLLFTHEPQVRALTPDGGVGIQVATCVPNECSALEIQKIYSLLDFGLIFYDELCQTKASQPKIDNAGSIATISFFGIILGIMLISTVYDTVLQYFNKRTYHPMLTAFSVLNNTKKILATSDSPNQISCLHGIRVISTMWVILGHKYSVGKLFPSKNYSDIADWMNTNVNMFILGGTVSVDSFFLMGGMVISYSYMSAVVKGTKFNILMYYIHRYIRLTPVLAVIILIHVTLVQYFGSGPLWPYIVQRDLVGPCENYWWKALLHIQNYGNMQMCVGQSWYISVDMQLFLLSPIILIPLKRWPLFTLVATGFLTVCSMLTSFLIGWFFELRVNPLAATDLETTNNFMKYYYVAVQTRAAPWLIGIILGYFLFQTKQSKKDVVINKALIIITWIGSLAVLCTCVFAGHNLITDEYDRLASSIHLALVRPAWAVALGFIIFACAVGYGGPINWFLSLPTFQVVSKLTFTMYMTHGIVLNYTIAQMRDVARFSNSEKFYTFWGDFALTLTVSFILTLMFESPIITIERCLFGTGKRKEKPSSLDVLQRSKTIPSP